MNWAEHLKSHPFAIAAHFRYSLVFTYAAPAHELQALLPACLQVDRHGHNGFVTAALVQTTGLRPAGFPSWMGHSFLLAGYRIFVRYTTSKGKRLRGLYILQSQTNKGMMTMLGNLMTHYNYRTIDVSLHEQESKWRLQSKKGGWQVEASLPQGAEVPLPASTVFENWQQARRFAGPLPFTFSYLPAQNSVLLVEGVRADWVPQPLLVHAHHFDVVQQLPLSYCQLANAFAVRNIEYKWKKGIVDPWQPTG
jgi:hypothetical protein